MKKLFVLGLLVLGLMVACKPQQPAYSVTYRGARIEVTSQEELDLVLACVNDIVNGSESVKDNYDYYLKVTVKPSNSTVLAFFEEVRELSENWEGE